VANAQQYDAKAVLSISRIPLNSSQWGLLNLDGLKFYWRTFWQLKRFVKQHNIEMIHCGRVLPEGLMAWLLNKVTGIPYICYVHGEDLEASALSRELNALTQRVMRNAQKIICNSHNSAAIVKRVDDSVMDKVVVMHPGADTQLFVPLDKPDDEFLQQYGWQDKKIILTVGRLQARKGQDMMIKAMPAILRKVPNAHYVIVGHGESLGSLKALVKSLALEEHVEFLTDCDDSTMIACYQHCTAFILPNRTEGQDIEGFGMVLVEAQSCAKPVIAGNSGGTVETLLKGETGFILDATKVDEISDTLVHLLSDPELQKRLGEAGRKHAVAQFDWHNAAKKAAAIFAQP
jgi:phosphatidylinositol alpha-1,6-mannosyltransferase